MRNIKSKTAKLRSPCMAIVFVMTLSMVLLLNSVQAASPAKTFPLDSQPFNKKYSQWSAEWWQFVLSFPVDINPNLDLTGGACGYGQHGPVWFLMGVFGATATRTCSIPEGKALFFPILNMVDINVTTQTPQELRAEIDPCMGAVTALLVEVDGVPIKTFEKLQKFRIKSKVFEATLPVNSLFAPDVAVSQSCMTRRAASPGERISTALRRPRAPRAIITRLAGTSSFFLKNSMRSVFARCSRAGAATRTFRVSPCLPTTSVLRALG